MDYSSPCICSKKSTFVPFIRYRNETVFREYEGTVIGRCIKCGVLKTFPGKKNRFDPKNTKCGQYETQSARFKKLFSPIVERINAFTPAGGDVLDVGCSSGILLQLLEKRYSVTGLEPNKKAFIFAKRKLGKNIRCSTLPAFVPRTKKRFDCIIYNHVLEHVGDPAKELSSIKKLLRKEGVLVIGVPNRDNWIFRIRQKYWESLLPGEHIWHFSVHDVVSLMKRAGFAPVSFRFEDDARLSYPWLKRIYFSLLSVVNSITGTGEAALVIFRKI